MVPLQLHGTLNFFYVDDCHYLFNGLDGDGYGNGYYEGHGYGEEDDFMK